MKTRSSRRSTAAAGGADPFMRGLTLGVLVGAAIAGSRIWRRLLRRTGRT